MKIILLERVQGLGQMGDVVEVRPGYARNFLLPKNKALNATKENLSYFEKKRKVLETENLEKRSEAQDASKKIEGSIVVMIRQAGESGHLYGSVSSKDIATALEKKGFKISSSQVQLDMPIKELGVFSANIKLHPEVEVLVHINVALTEEEAETQYKSFSGSTEEEKIS